MELSTCFHKGSKGQRQLVFALWEQCDGNAAADALHLVGVMARLADGAEHFAHALPVFLFGAELSETHPITNTLGLKAVLFQRPSKTDLYFNDGVSQAQAVR